MAKIFGRYLLVLMLLLPTAILFVGHPKISSNVAFTDDAMGGEDDETTVETDDGVARLGKNANHRLEALELVLQPTVTFTALDENVSVCPVQVHDELFHVAVAQSNRCLAQKRTDGRHTRRAVV